MKTHLGTLWLGLVSLALLGGCESSDTDPPEEPPAPPPPAQSGVPPLDSNVVWLDSHTQVGATHWPDGDTPDGGQGSPVDGLPCMSVAPNDYHVHAHLSIFLNGQALAVPNEIGSVDLSPTNHCHYALHTHDASGMLHEHATTQTLFTLGQFFRVWGQPLQRDNIAGLVGLPVVVYATDDGVVREYTGDLAALQLLSHREITIQVGTAVTTIPNFRWSGD